MAPQASVVGASCGTHTPQATCSPAADVGHHPFSPAQQDQEETEDHARKRQRKRQKRQHQTSPKEGTADKVNAVNAALAGDGAQPGGGSSAEFARFMADEIKVWGEVVRSSGAKVD